MIFSELYSAYYQTVANILTSAVSGNLTEKEMQRLVTEHAFSESVLSIIPALKEGRWQLLTKDMRTPVIHEPTMPLTMLEKRWLKAISLDPRVALFDFHLDGLEDIEPLFTAEDYVVFDRYGDGDNYCDEKYIRYFRMILQAIREHYPLRIEILGRNFNPASMNLMPDHLEYSEKDDKFRLISTGCRYAGTINLSKIISCKPYLGDKVKIGGEPRKQPCCLTMELFNRRNALERLFLHFAHFEKQAEQIGVDRYRIILHYDRTDETEILIRVLSFGPFVKVIEPDSFVQLISDRLQRQISRGPL